MKTSLPVLSLSIIAMAWSCPTSRAAESRPATEPPPLTMEALVNELLTTNPELAFYRAEIAAAKGEQRTAKAFGKIGRAHV